MTNDLEVVEDRYNRQELIEGWDQERLGSARVAIVGAGQLANYTAVALTALGVGSIEIYDNSKLNGEHEFLLFKCKEGESKARGLETMLREINPSAHVKGMNLSLERNPTISILGQPDVMIDTTNSPESKRAVLDYAQYGFIPVVSVSADATSGQMYVLHPVERTKLGRLEDYSGKIQGSAISGIMGGIVAEEVRKLVMPFSWEEVPVEKLGYSLSNDRRFSFERSNGLGNPSLKDKKILIVGAGALGNFAALGMALQGVGNIDIMDYDEVESTNLNRQILFYDAVGKKKATALAQRISEITPEINIRGIVSKLGENTHYFRDNRPDLILDCVDSFAVRAIINYFAIRNKIPLVSGGTNPRSGQVVVYEPGKSACLDCKLGVEKALAEERAADSCRYAPDPSVIMTNQIIGNMIVGESVKVLDRAYGEPVRRILKYDSDAQTRGGLIGPDQACECEKPGVEKWLKDVDAKATKNKE